MGAASGLLGSIHTGTRRRLYSLEDASMGVRGGVVEGTRSNLIIEWLNGASEALEEIHRSPYYSLVKKVVILVV